MKVEPRGKFGGVKVHLDPDECQVLLNAEDSPIKLPIAFQAQYLINKIGLKIRTLLAEQPNLLGERSKEEVIAILAKESEKAALQLAAVKAGAGIGDKVDEDKLKAALLKYVK